MVKFISTLVLLASTTERSKAALTTAELEAYRDTIAVTDRTITGCNFTASDTSVYTGTASTDSTIQAAYVHVPKNG